MGSVDLAAIVSAPSAEGGERSDHYPDPAELCRDLLAELTDTGWTIRTGDWWSHLEPQPNRHRIQGWKLHVSATVLSAPQVLRACLPVLTAAGVAFKFAASARVINLINDFRAPRGASGKFLTVYPANDDIFRELAAQLHEATAGLVGPIILSDARYAAGSLVFYRYGAFDGYRELTWDGTYRDCVLDPDTYPVEDRRDCRFSPPAWAVSPLPTPAASRGAAGSSGRSVLLHGRYRVDTAIRHANKGGVYLARDTRTDQEVVIKEARPHVGTDALGRDATDFLRHEAVVLRRLAGTGVVPAVIEEFRQNGHSFLVEERLPGRTLWAAVTGVRERGEPRPSAHRIADLVRRLVTVLQVVHQRGVVLRDLAPANVMVLPDGDIRLIDVEHAALGRAEDPTGWSVLGPGHGTPGISAPEQFARRAPDPRGDLYSLGVILLQQATLSIPIYLADEPAARDVEQRYAELLDRMPGAHQVSGPIHRLITGLIRTRPEDRLALSDVDELRQQIQCTADADHSVSGYDPADAAAPELDETHCATLVRDIVDHLAATMSHDSATAPWPPGGFGADAEPCAVQYGTAGLLAALARIHHHEPTEPARSLATELAGRVLRHLDAHRHPLPGLQFGAAGTAWALVDAGMAFGHDTWVQRGTELAAALPTRWPNPDVAHGLAGLGTCLLHLATVTGEDRLLDRAAACAEAVLAAVDPDPDRTLWTIPASLDSALAGYRSYGYAHGTAGIGAFLLAVGRATGRCDVLEAARRCGETLLTARVDRPDGGYWPDGPDSADLHVWWCNGSSGVGTFLIRLYGHTGDDRFLGAARDAARAVLATRGLQSPAYCHGLSGNADFLLDLAAVTGDDVHRRSARALAGLMWAKRVHRDGRGVLPDESEMTITAGFGAGLAGPLAFLTRLQYGGPRLFHPDPDLTDLPTGNR